MGLDMPKQFVMVDGKPILMYTLQPFQDHPSIDSIGVVCIEGYQNILMDYAQEYGITKLDWIVVGGDSAQDSIHNGILHLQGLCHPQDIVVIHDGIRPLVDASVISDVLATCRAFGNGVAALPYNEQIFQIDQEDPYSTVDFIPRDSIRRVATPQAYHYDVLASRYQEAYEKHLGIGPSSYTNTMMVELGERLYFSVGSDKNIKLTTPDDLALFQALLKVTPPEHLLPVNQLL